MMLNMLYRDQCLCRVYVRMQYKLMSCTHCMTSFLYSCILAFGALDITVCYASGCLISELLLSVKM